MIEKLLKGEYTAVVSDDTQLLGYAYADDSCSLHILGDMIEPFDLAVAFRRGFPSDAFRAAVSSALLDLQESGVLTVRSCPRKPQPLFTRGILWAEPLELLCRFTETTDPKHLQCPSQSALMLLTRWSGRCRCQQLGWQL